MYVYHYCNQVNDHIFDEKINKSKINEIMKKYELILIGDIKEYWSNNVRVISRNNKLYFDNINDEDIYYDTTSKFLVQKMIKKPITSYNFYNMDSEEEYILYENISNNITYQLKEYNSHLTFQCICEEKNNFIL